VSKDHPVAKRVAIYLRVSTGEQTTENQRRELEEVAARHGWRVVEVFEDAGISGAKARDKRPGLDRLLKAVARRDVDMVAAWSVDWLAAGARASPIINNSGRFFRRSCRGLIVLTCQAKRAARRR
jgi:DNA invertase Pin-like site-specific DNA recombinase